MQDNLHLRLDKHKKKEIMIHAKEDGLSLTAFVLMSINAQIEKENMNNNLRS